MDRDRWKKLLALSPRVQLRRGEQRQGRRYPLQVELLEINGQSLPGCFLTELSAEDARLELPFALPSLSPLSIRFRLPGHQDDLVMHGRVAWSRPGVLRHRFVLKLQFYQPHWEIERLLEQPCR